MQIAHFEISQSSDKAWQEFLVLAQCENVFYIGIAPHITALSLPTASFQMYGVLRLHSDTIALPMQAPNGAVHLNLKTVCALVPLVAVEGDSARGLLSKISLKASALSSVRDLSQQQQAFLYANYLDAVDPPRIEKPTGIIR